MAARPERVTNVAIACQGGGSLTAFTAGVLSRLLTAQEEGKPFRVVALSGTSGGAICALLAWYGLIKAGPSRASELLYSFWHANSATSYFDSMVNNAVMLGAKLQGAFGIVQPSSSWLSNWGQARLRVLIEQHVDFSELEHLVARHQLLIPRLMISAVDVCCGNFKVFHASQAGIDIDIDAVMASTALPTLFRAVRIGDHIYWDGLFAQNPPIRNFLIDCPVEQRPDEVWLLQINPEQRKYEPTSAAEIMLRRSELSGNLSLRLEIDSIKRVNQWLKQAFLPRQQFKTVCVRRIQISPELTHSLDISSKLDRRPAFIRELLAAGEREAAVFVEHWPEAANGEVYP